MVKSLLGHSVKGRSSTKMPISRERLGRFQFCFHNFTPYDNRRRMISNLRHLKKLSDLAPLSDLSGTSVLVLGVVRDVASRHPSGAAIVVFDMAVSLGWYAGVNVFEMRRMQVF